MCKGYTVVTATDFRPMTEFDPWEPAILHDQKSGSIETWTGENALDYLKECRAVPDGSVEWRNYVFDGWGDVLGG